MFVMMTFLCLLSFNDTSQSLSGKITSSQKTKNESLPSLIRDLNWDSVERHREKNVLPTGSGSADEFSENAVARAWFLALFRLADNGRSKKERAAWVSEVNGEYEFDPWPETGESMSVTSARPPKAGEWNVHTHPNHFDPRPSHQDVMVARELGIPVFTIHREGIWKYDPATDQRNRVADVFLGRLDERLVAQIISVIRAKDALAVAKQRMQTAQRMLSKSPKSRHSRKAKKRLQKAVKAGKAYGQAYSELRIQLALLRNLIRGPDVQKQASTMASDQ